MPCICIILSIIFNLFDTNHFQNYYFNLVKKFVFKYVECVIKNYIFTEIFSNNRQICLPDLFDLDLKPPGMSLCYLSTL